MILRSTIALIFLQFFSVATTANERLPTMMFHLPRAIVFDPAKLNLFQGTTLIGNDINMLILFSSPENHALPVLDSIAARGIQNILNGMKGEQNAPVTVYNGGLNFIKGRIDLDVGANLSIFAGMIDRLPWLYTKKESSGKVVRVYFDYFFPQIPAEIADLNRKFDHLEKNEFAEFKTKFPRKKPDLDWVREQATEMVIISEMVKKLQASKAFDAPRGNELQAIVQARFVEAIRSTFQSVYDLDGWHLRGFKAATTLTPEQVGTMKGKVIDLIAETLVGTRGQMTDEERSFFETALVEAAKASMPTRENSPWLVRLDYYVTRREKAANLLSAIRFSHRLGFKTDFCQKIIGLL